MPEKIPVPVYRGKVRDVYDLGSSLLMCSTDRVSAFDVIFNETIPGKGKILTRVSNLWFEYFKDIPNHILETDYSRFPKEFSDSYFKDRSILVKKCKRIDYECVVRGYLSGSGYKEYKQFGTIAKKQVRTGYEESDRLDEPMFTPAVKNDEGHDENISEEELKNRIGTESFSYLKNTSIQIYSRAAKLVEKSDLILCDTKFEFGILDDKIILIDELLTPDSSRYWEKSTYRTGISPPSYDKQILRNYLETLNWDKNPPPPPLPDHIISELSAKYLQLEKNLRNCIQVA